MICLHRAQPPSPQQQHGSNYGSIAHGSDTAGTLPAPVHNTNEISSFLTDACQETNKKVMTRRSLVLLRTSLLIVVATAVAVTSTFIRAVVAPRIAKPTAIANTLQMTSKQEEQLLSTSSQPSYDFKQTFAGVKSKTNKFPDPFLFGVATSSYQIEGAVSKRGPTVWDMFAHANNSAAILDQSTGDVACDHYHRVTADVQLMKDIQIQAYRFSIAWTRILPSGSLAGGINQSGVNFYNHLIDTLLENNILPVVTLFHWDTPQAVEAATGGWLDQGTAAIFANDYARTAFQLFGDRVKTWITMNEPWTVAVNGYNTGVHAPGRYQQARTEPYVVAHHLLLAHAQAVQIYRKEFQTVQRGRIGIANSGDYRYPLRANDKSCSDAAQRAMLFQYGWFVDPLYFGDYPVVMRERLGDRLPRFTTQEKELLLAANVDFLGLNYYSSALAATPEVKADYDGYWADIHVAFHDFELWRKNDMSWNVVPDGLREMLLWIDQRYNHPTIFVTENGSAEHEPTINAALFDEHRRTFIKDHLRAVADAISTGANVAGYFVWSLMDNFEWQFGYQRRFGIYYVDFETLERTPKSSALFYSKTIETRGEHLDMEDDQKESGDARNLQVRRPRRMLPERILMGYASHKFDAVQQAIIDGANVITWAFVDIVSVDQKETIQCAGTVDQRQARQIGESGAEVRTTLDLPAIRALIRELDASGYDHVVHLVGFGGWNGPHLDPKLDAQAWFRAFDEHFGEFFHGIDWDLEGNDDMQSPYNTFTLECLNKMGEVSRMAHAAGYVVSMAPAQSYFDVGGESWFDRGVNFTNPTREWHNEFSYFGRNVYAYLMKRYGHWIDLVSIQFYESYSRAAKAVFADGVSRSAYLFEYVRHLAVNDFQFSVNFASDPSVGLPDSNVTLPLSKLVFGFANGWTNEANEKALFVPSEQVEVAWKRLQQEGLCPRGFMFWTIDEEGNNGVHFARGLGKILHEE